MTWEKRDFETLAASWDDEPRRLKLATDVAQAIMRVAGLAQDMDVLDYGCGTGLITMHLQPHVRAITGADTSPGMLAILQEKIRKSGVSNVSTVDLRKSPGAELTGKYHLIVTSMALHHIPDVPSLFRQFLRLLHPGGRLCIADLNKEDGSFHDDPTGVAHFGFDLGQLKFLLGREGFSEIKDMAAARIIKGHEVSTRREYPVFLLTALKRDETGMAYEKASVIAGF